MTEEPEQNSDSSPVSVPASDRRAQPRQRIRALSYVQLGDSNGGIVLNISEGGIAVQAAEPLDEGEGVIAMRIEVPGSRKRLEVSGEIVWVGESRKEAGFRFVNLREDALGRIRSWIAREGSPGTAEQESEEEVEAPVVKAEAAGAATVVTEHAVARDEDSMAEAEEAAVEDAAAEDEEQVSEIEAPLERDEESVEFDEEPVEEFAGKPVEVADGAVVAMEAAAEVAEEKAAAAPPIRKAEDRAQKIAAPVLTFEKKPQTPVTPFAGISGTHGAPAFAVAAAPPTAARYSSGDAAASLFPKPRASGGSAAADDGWKSFRVQLQSGWFLAVLVLLLATISFVAGMAVRRGALNAVMGDVDDVAQPKGAPAPSVGNLEPNPYGNGAAAATAAGPATPLQIEIVDLENHHWTIAAANGANHGEVSATRQTQASGNAVEAADDTVASAAAKVPNQNSAQAASSNEAAAAKPGAPMLLSLPETPISASGSIAIRATGMVPIPSGEIQSAQRAHNLQIGELTNLVEPVYPPAARQARLEGTVKLHVVVGANGEIQSFRAVSGPDSLAQAAMIAVREWRYRPTLLNGRAVETQEDVTFVFRLPN